MNSRRITISFVSLVVFTCALLVHAQSSDSTIVKIEGGTVRGIDKTGVISWKGIPYAAPLDLWEQVWKHGNKQQQTTGNASPPANGTRSP